MQKFKLSESDVHDLVKQYPEIEKIVEMKAHYPDTHSPFNTIAEFLLEFANDIKAQLPAPSRRQQTAEQDEAHEPSATAPSRKAR